MRAREAAAKEETRKAAEEVGGLHARFRGSGELSLMDQAATIERDRKAAERKARAKAGDADFDLGSGRVADGVEEGDGVMI